jgi:hypothetical protein
MLDMRCVVCGGHWDSHGVHHGDMLRWEASLFLKGAGCPSCLGESPFPEQGPMEQLAGVPHPEEALWRQRIQFDLAEGGAFEFTLRVEKDGSNDNRVPWVRPTPEPLWTCAGCGVFVILDPDTDYPHGQVDGVTGGEVAWRGGQSVHYNGGVSFRYWCAPGCVAPSPRSCATVAGEDYCPGCVELCGGCGEVWVFSRSDLFGDVYDPGASFPWAGRSLCITCLRENGFSEEGE